MISHEVTQRNIWPYFIGLGLLVFAFLLGWLASGALQTTGLQLNAGSPPVSAPVTEPEFYFKERGNVGLDPAAFEPTQSVEPAGDKFNYGSGVVRDTPKVPVPSAIEDLAGQKYMIGH